MKFILGVFTCSGGSVLIKSDRFISNWKVAQHLHLGWNFAGCFTQQLGI